MTQEQAQEWSAHEVVDGFVLVPEIDAVAIVRQSQDERDKVLALYQAKVDTLMPIDETSVRSIGEFIEQCKLAAKRVEEKRTLQVAPLNKQVSEINAIYKPVCETFVRFAKAATIVVNKFLDDKRKAAELEQQRLVVEVARKQADLDRRAQEAKAQAAQALESGDVVAAAVLDGKAAILEQRAAEVIPMQVAVPSGKVELTTSTVSFGGAKKVWALGSWDKKRPLRAIDTAFAPLVGDLSTLPEGVRFLLQHADVNPVHLNASYKGGLKFPAPFVEVNDYSGSRVR